MKKRAEDQRRMTENGRPQGDERRDLNERASKEMKGRGYRSKQGRSNKRRGGRVESGREGRQEDRIGRKQRQEAR